jgi:hypothetical protein
VAFCTRLRYRRISRPAAPITETSVASVSRMELAWVAVSVAPVDPDGVATFPLQLRAYLALCRLWIKLCQLCP